MLRHATGYKLANDGQDTRAIQHLSGHRKHSAYHPLHRTGGRSVQGFLARLSRTPNIARNGLLNPKLPRYTTLDSSRTNPCCSAFFDVQFEILSLGASGGVNGGRSGRIVPFTRTLSSRIESTFRRKRDSRACVTITLRSNTSRIGSSSSPSANNI